MGRFNLKQLCYERLIRPILFTKDTPRSKAGGVGLGVFIAFTPTVGIQMPIAFGAATILGVNSPLAVAMAWLTNPITVPPIYYFEYRVGAWLLGMDAIGSSSDFWRQWETISAAHPSYWARVTHLAADVGYPLFIGSLPVALFLALISYPLTLWFCNRRLRAQAAGAPATLTPVGGELLPEPAHDPLPGGESTVLVLDGATRDRLARERGTPPALGGRGIGNDRGEGSGGGPAAGAGALLLAMALLGSATRCAEPRDPWTTPGAQTEARTEGELPVFAGWCDESTLAVVAPLHAAGGRDRWAQQKLAQLAPTAGARTFLSLSLFRFAAGPFELARTGAQVEFESAAGRVAALTPSDALAGIGPTADARWFAAELGAAGVPNPAVGQSVRVLLAVPGTLDLASCTRVTLAGRDGSVGLEGHRVGAVAWDEFRSQPDRARFEQLIGTGGAAGRDAAGRTQEGRGNGEPEGSGR